MPPETVVISLAGIGLAGYTVAVIGRLIAKAIDRRGGAAPKELVALEGRLGRIEQAIDAMAVEVERISEGQRFTTKLLSDRADSSRQPEPRA